MEDTARSTVYVVDDDQAMRKSLRWLVETIGVPVTTFGRAAGFLSGYDGGPGCLILDVMMPEMTGLELQTELNRRGVQIPVIVLTGYGDVPSAVQAIKNGAIEFLEKPFEGEVLLEQIRRALELDSRRRKERVAGDVIRERLARLTRRETEILGLVVDGLSSKEIAARLDVSFKTVEAHRAHVMRKMEAESVANLVRMVVSLKQSGPVPPGTPES